MKKRLLILLASAMTAALLLTGCNDPAPSSNFGIGDATANTLRSNVKTESATEMYDDADYTSGQSNGEYNEAAFNTQIISNDLSQKIIYTTSANIETIHYEESIQTLLNLLTQYNGFIENSYQRGTNYRDQYYGTETYRHASYTLRIPKENYSQMSGDISKIGNVVSINNSAENITESYTDTEARLKAYKAEEKSLLEMLEQAETVDEMLSVKSYLRDVQYEIESMTSMLNNWDKRVSYSTFNIDINEVENLTLINTPQETYWESIVSGFKNSLNEAANFFKDMFKWIAINSPLILTSIVFIALIIAVCWAFIKILLKLFRTKSKKKIDKVKNIKPNKVPEQKPVDTAQTTQNTTPKA